MQLFERYEQYKPAPIECLGEVPAHWEISLLNYLFAENKERNSGNIEETVLSLSYGKVILKKGKENFGLLPESFETYQIVKPGYLIFRFTDMQNDHVSLRVGLAQNRGIITSAYVGLKPRKELSARYYYYLFHTLDILKFYYSFGGGVRQSLDFKGMRKLQLPIPPLPEQLAIANFLDRQTARIEQFIALKEKTIALLQEQKTAIINRAVTQGLNSTAPMKESGIEWLGQIPAHWEVKKLFLYFKERKEKNTGIQEQNVRSLSYGQIVPRNIESNFGLLPMSFETYQIIEPNNLIFRLTDLQNDKKSLRVGLVKDKGIITSAYICIEVTKEINCNYISHLLYIYDVKKVFYGFGGGIRQSASFEDLKRLPLLIPPLPEQHQIVAHIEQQTAKINQAIAQAEKEIALIKEYKDSLICEAVTGRIRVTTTDG